MANGQSDGYDGAIPKAIVLLLLLTPLLAPRSVAGRSVAGTEMPDSIRVEGSLLILNGVSVYKKVGMRILVAGLWLDHAERDARTILDSDRPRSSMTHFLHHVSAKRICDSWRKGLRENTPGASPDVREQFQTLYEWTADLDPGDEITVTYLPGKGSTVVIAGIFKGSLPGKPFADAFFACAIGPKPTPGDKFKRGLLGE